MASSGGNAGGHLDKMAVSLDQPVSYRLPLDQDFVPLNERLGSTLRLRFTGAIHCRYCGRKTTKSFNQGYCFPCFKALARCDSCIVSPEKCHFDAGTCREPAWALKHCMTDHIVYLANSSGLKVGITRAGQVPTRWIDQGAVQALPIMRVQTRLQSGLVEALLRRHVADRTDWRAMLCGPAEPLDLPVLRNRLRALCDAEVADLQAGFGLQALQWLERDEVTRIAYPVLAYPAKISAFNLDKTPVAEGTLTGIKGQYLIFDTGVINIRKYTAYHVEVDWA